MRDRIRHGQCGLWSVALICAFSGLSSRPASAQTAATPPATSCPGDNGGLTLSPGFCASVYADNIGHARHMVVSADGTLYANTWSGRYFRNSPPPAGGFVVAMKDTRGSGHADVIQRLGVTVEAGGTGGSGIALYNGSLYAEENGRILRYKLDASGQASGAGDIVVSGMPLTGDHPMHPFVIDPKGQIFVDIGTATNSCQAENRIANSPGLSPCKEKEMRGGTWRYDASKTGQVFSAAARYASGIRNGEGFAFDDAGRLFATQHGRDQLFQNFPKLYNAEQGADLPAEELVQVVEGADYGWPECYYDQNQKRLVLAPEYGGDGGKTAGVCAQRRAPVAAFPGHWAPNDLAIYHGTKFPMAYRGGAFIVFHGSWNRAPLPQGGYNIVFQPLADGKATGPYVIFADGFAGAHKEPGRAAFRPTGVAEAPDGSLFVSDDVHGRIWRITYNGDGSDKIAAAPAPTGSDIASTSAVPPEGLHPDAGRTTPSLPTPPGATSEQVALGNRIFHGEASNGTCSGCHGTDAGGSPVGPALNTGHWLWGDGSLTSITSTIEKGVEHPKQYQGVMPALGGSELSKQDLAAVAAYVWALGHPKS
jgi:glucose/arabinose dehydrogenase/mono/diheme cytochrome c family protein